MGTPKRLLKKKKGKEDVIYPLFQLGHYTDSESRKYTSPNISTPM